MYIVFDNWYQFIGHLFVSYANDLLKKAKLEIAQCESSSFSEIDLCLQYWISNDKVYITMYVN